MYEIEAPSGNKYYGSSVRLGKRLIEHKRQMRKGDHGNSALRAAAKKYGVENMTFRVLAVLEPSQRLEVEQKLLDRHFGTPQCYNQFPSARGGGGQVMSSEARAKMSRIHKGKKLSPEHIQQIIDCHTGRKHPPRSDEWRRKQSEAHKGPWSEERKAAWRGRTLTPEHRANIRAGSIRPDVVAARAEHRRLNPIVVGSATRQKLSAASKGRKHTEETKKMIGDLKRGKKQPWASISARDPEVRKKMSESRRRNAEARKQQSLAA